MIEVKDDDFFKSITQNAVQLKSALSNCKYKANEMEEETFVGKAVMCVRRLEAIGIFQFFQFQAFQRQ
jgi:hypothetical protein